MNERIRELAIQSIAVWNAERQQCEVEPDELEKFAELIVRECINICDKEYVAQIGTPAGAYNSAVKKCRDRIAKNFGISE